MTIEQQMREAFHSYMLFVGATPKGLTMYPDGTYSNSWSQDAWSLWQAAHQSATEQMKPLVEALKAAQNQLDYAGFDEATKSKIDSAIELAAIVSKEEPLFFFWTRGEKNRKAVSDFLTTLKE